MLWSFKCNVQIIHVATYIALFLPDSNKRFLICLVRYIHICFYYFQILCSSYFHPLFLTLFSTRHILQFIMFDLISLQPARNIKEIKKNHSPSQKKKCRVNYNQNIFGSKYELFLPPNQFFFLAFGHAKIFLSNHILMNILIYTLFCDKKVS